MTATGWTCVSCGAWCGSTREHTCGTSPFGCTLCDEVFRDVPAWAAHADEVHGGAIERSTALFSANPPGVVEHQYRLLL